MRASTGIAVPVQVVSTLEGVVASLREAAGDNLLSLVVFGGVARGRYIPGESDINLAVVLRDASGPSIAKLSTALRDAFRAHHVEPFIVARDEIPRLAATFPTKLLDMQRTHLVLFGDNPFQSLVVDREHVRARVEQELRNLALRQRHRFVRICDDPRALAIAADDAAVPLAVNLRALLWLRGEVSDEFQPTLAIFDLAARTFGLDAEALAVTKRVHQHPGDATLDSAMFGRLLAAITKAADVAAGIKA